MEDYLIRRILVVDDERDYLTWLSRVLKKSGYQCTTATDAFEAIKRLEQGSFELVISDITMAGKNGLQLTREARQLDPTLVFIVMTGHVEEYSYMDIIHAGASDFILKPFESAELHAKISRIERERQAMARLFATNEALSWELGVNSAVAELSETFLNPLSVTEISSLLLKHAMRVTDSFLGYIKHFGMKSEYGISSEFGEHFWERVQQPGDKDVFRESSSQWGLILDNIAPILENQRQQTIGGTEPAIHRFISVPVIASGSLIGRVIVANAVRDYVEKDLSALNRLTSKYALILQNLHANAETKKMKEYLEAVFDSSPASIGIIGKNWKPIKWNKAATEVYGYTLDELLSMNVSELCADKESLQRILEDLRRDGFVSRYEIDIRRKDASIAPSELSINLLKDSKGETMGSACVAMDVSNVKRTLAELQAANQQLHKEIQERRRADEELLESERRFAAILTNISLIAVCMDVQGRITFCNDYFLRLVGWRQEDILGLDWFDTFVPPDSRNRLRQILSLGLSHGEIPAHYDNEIITPRGERRLISWTNVLMSDAKGNVFGMTSVGRDVTEHRMAQDELRRTHGEMAQLVSSISMILIRISENDQVMLWNSSAEKEFGLPESEVLGKPLSECGIAWDWKSISEGIHTCRSKRASLRLNDIRFTRPDGKEGFLGIAMNPIGDDSNQLADLLIIGRNVTERRILESQLAQAQKLESIGQLAAGIAHEINTPTQYVGDNIRFLQDAFHDLSDLLETYKGWVDRMKAESSMGELVSELEEAARDTDLDYLIEEIPRSIVQSLEGTERISKIVRAMKEFSHPGSGEKTAIDINKAIESTITVARNEWKYVAETVTDFDPLLPLVPCLPGEFNQVILNLIINASHAIADVVKTGSNGKGTISVSTRNKEDMVEIRISDTGTGIPENIRSRIFDPFFTTKQVGRGTGQGLAIAHSVVTDKHGGTIRFETEMGKGTTFIINLPNINIS